MNPAVREPAVSWVSCTGRRFFTRRAALRSSAWSLIRERCDCEPDVGHACHYHRPEESPLANRLVERLVRLWGRQSVVAPTPKLEEFSSREYRVTWKREGLAKKVRRYSRASTAKGLLARLLATAEEAVQLRGHEPEELFCCSGLQCGCGGKTYLQEEEEYRAELPPLEYVFLEERQVGPWSAVSEPQEGRDL